MIFKGHRPWERERLGWKDLGRDGKNSYFDYHKESFKERDLVEGKKILGESLFDYYWINLSQGWMTLRM